MKSADTPDCELARVALISLNSSTPLSENAVKFAKAVADQVRSEYPPEKSMLEEIQDRQKADGLALWKTLVGSEALAKSLSDPYIYLLRLRSGETIHFDSARLISPEWIHLSVCPIMQDENCRFPWLPDRGADVRLADIVWVMDAPHEKKVRT